MADDQRDVLAASTDPEQAVEAPTAIDADELAKARLDERWREFCLSAERYVAETTRPSTASGSLPRFRGRAAARVGFAVRHPRSFAG
jgi:hypothetical protein